MQTSGFINSNLSDDKIEFLGITGATSNTFKRRIDGRLYFMKQLRREYACDSRYREAFFKEFEAGKSIESPYVVKYICIKEDSDGLYILMEYINSITLDEKLATEPEYFQKWQNVKKLLVQLLQGLSALHKCGIVHCDVKPQNILLTKTTNEIVLVDLGFCLSNSNDHTTGCTKIFAAPEMQAGNIDEIDMRSDIYSVGCLMKHIQKRTKAKYPRLFNDIKKRCLKVEKSERFTTTDEIINVLNKQRVKSYSIAALSALLLLPFAYLGITENKESVSIEHKGAIYRILSQEEGTCEIIGGNGNEEGNIYIQDEIKIDNRLYKSVSIADSAFFGSKILSVHIPEGIREIGHDAFADCDSIVTISLPETIENTTSAFTRMSRLKAVKISSGIKAISHSAFVDCISLVAIHILEGVERLQYDAFGRCTGLKNISLPQSLKVIERGVFWECTGLEEIVIPENVTEIGDYAFFHCDSLEHIYIHAAEPPVIAAIIDNPLTTIHVPAASLKQYKEHPYWMNYNIVGDL